MARVEYTEGVLCNCGHMVERVTILTSPYCPCCGERIINKEADSFSATKNATSALFKVTHKVFTSTIEYVRPL
jgi:predicted RNA-binding Zn-ribbon protein involved in translation (DUF1610 family)